MSKPVDIDEYMSLMPLDEDELIEKQIPASMLERVKRLRGMYAFWLQYPRQSLSELVHRDVSMFHVKQSQAYDDINLVQVMLGNLQNATKDFWRWKINQEIDEDRQAAKRASDFRALASMQKNRIKNNRTDTPDEPELGFEKIIPAEFKMSNDPTIIGLKDTPNLKELIVQLERKYGADEVTYTDFEELEDKDDG